MGMFDDLPTVQQGAKTAAPVGMFDDLPDIRPLQQSPQFDAMGNPTGANEALLQPSGQNGTFADVLRSIPSGLERGAIGAASLYGALGQGEDWLLRKATGMSAEEQARLRSQTPQIGPDTVLTPENVTRAAETVTGPMYEPQTTAGKYVRAASEFIPAALAGPFGIAKTALPKIARPALPEIAKTATTYGIVPGIASEAAGQATEGTAAEPYARGGAALATGGAGAFLTRPNVAETAISRAAGGMTAEQLDRMESLLSDAKSMGIDLTRAEAAQAITGGATKLGNLQRLAEGSGEMLPFFAKRPQQVETAGRQAIEEIAPAPAAPSVIGPQVGEAAQGVIGDAQAAINRTTRPLYDQAAQARVGLPVQQALEGDPLYAHTLEAIRADPALERTIANLPNDSPAVLDLVQRRLREQAENARVPGQASTSNLAAANLEDARTAPIAAAETATGSRPATATTPAQVGSYEAARAQQAALRQKYLEPLTQGPLGRLAKEDMPTQRAIEALFPVNPLPNSAGEVQDAVGALTARNPWAARQLVRAHVESVFNQATRDLQAGPAQFGGATFRAKLTGNTQQAANLAAAISALPNGQQVLAGFDRMLQVMEATGQRQRLGSLTSFNTEMLHDLKTGGVSRDAATLISGAGLKIPQHLREVYQRWNLGKNVSQIADLLTNPEAADAFRMLASAPPGTTRAAYAAGRLAALGNQSQRSRDKQ